MAENAELSRLVVSLEASITKYERAMAKATGQTNRTARRIETRFNKMANVSNAAFGRMFGYLASAAALRGAQRLIDSSIKIENTLKVAGLQGEELKRVYEDLFQSAQRNFVPIEGLSELYGRAALAQKELGASSEDLTNFTDNVAVALRVAGKSASETRGALIQLSQAIGAGIVRSEEFNSLSEGALPILQAVAAGLEEAGGNVADLRRLVIDGKVSSTAFFRAFEAGSVILKDKVANAEVTVSQAMVRLQNVLVDTAGNFNDGTEASESMVAGISNMELVIREFGAQLEILIPKLGDAAHWMDRLGEKGWEVAESFAEAGEELREYFGLNDIGHNLAKRLNELKFLGEFSTFKGSKHLETTFKLVGETPTDDELIDILTGYKPPQSLIIKPELGPAGGPVVTTPSKAPTVDTVSLSDYPIDPDGSGTKKSPAQKFQDALDAQARRNAMLRQETALQSSLNPLLKDYGYQIERLRIQQELENDATKNGLELTPDRKRAIEELADGYAMARAEAERLSEAQDRARTSMQDWFDVGRSMTQTFIDDLTAGKSAVEALGNAFNQLGNKLISLGLDSLFGTGNGGFGLIGQAFGLPRYATGTNNHPGGMAWVGERGPELVNLPGGSQVIPHMPSMAMSGSGGGGFTYAPQIDNRGADSAAVARLERFILQDRAVFEARVRQIVSRRWAKGW